jgi:hypothetical protein
MSLLALWPLLKALAWKVKVNYAWIVALPAAVNNAFMVALCRQ